MKSKMSEGMIERVVAAVQLGMPPLEAALGAGVSKSTFYEWWRRGEGDAQSGDPERMTSLHARFFVDVTEARHGLDLKILKNFVSQHLLARSDWRAFSWWLSKRLPDAFGDKVGAKGGQSDFSDHLELLAGMRRDRGLTERVDTNDDPSAISSDAPSDVGE